MTATHGRRRLGAALATALVLGACASGSDSATDAPTTAAGDPKPETSSIGSESSGTGGDGGGEPVPSSGCGNQDPELVATTEGTFTSGGVERTYLLGVPSSNDGQTPMPVVVDMHGFGEPVEWHAASSGMVEAGEREGFVTLMPQGLGIVPVLSMNRSGGDTAYINELLDALEAGLCIDTSRVYLTGYSGGAMMTALLACDDADRFAAAAPVAGQALFSGCDPTRSVPVRAFHGTDDPVLGFDSGSLPASLAVIAEVFGDEAVAEALEQGKGDALEPVMLTDEAPGAIEVLTAWAQRNGCGPTYTEEPVADTVRRLSWEGCARDATTEMYVIDGAGHTWPGSDELPLDESFLGSPSFEIDATEEIWDFFQQHSL